MARLLQQVRESMDQNINPPSTQPSGAEMISCLVCGGRYESSPISGLLYCSSCGFTSADVHMSDEEFHSLYGEDYFHGREYLDYVAEEDSLRLNFKRRISVLKSLVPDLSAAELFEIGCAYGFFLDEMKSMVKQASGIDISAEAVRYAVDKLHAKASLGDYLTFDIGRQVDVVTMWDTIEHLKRPDLFVQKAAGDLKVGGILAITTGDIGSLNARLRGAAWRMIHPPTHMHYFSTATLSKLLVRNGFQIVHVSHPGNSRRVRSILFFLLMLKSKHPKLYGWLEKVPMANARVTLNLYDIMFVVGRKQ